MQENQPRASLNNAQKTAAEAPKGPLLIVAGAGTGKTTTLTNRLLYLIEQGIAPERICAITFTNKAASEMENRMAKYGKLGGGAGKPYIGTFHSLGAKILRRECRFFGREHNFTIFDGHDSFDLIKKAVKGFIPKSTEKSTAKKKETPVFFAQKISEMKNLGGPGESELVQAVFSAYETLLKNNNAFDFDDLIQKPVELFASSPAALKKYQTLYDAILVDEWQDINPKQYELVKYLAGEHRNLSVVGDDEQTIYSWRYANIKTFLNFDKEWKGSAVHFLEENYRSTGTIINAASAVVQNNRFRTPKKIWTSNPDGEPITLFEAWGENDEAAWIASQIENRKSSFDRTRDNKSENETTAILYRTNAQSRAIEQALIRHDIPYRIFGGLKFYERREVKDAVAALRWVANRKDDLSKERLEKNLTKRKFAVFQSAVLGTQDWKPSTILKIFLETFGYFEYLEEGFINADERQENIAELAAFVADFENLDELLERLSLLQSTDDENKQKEAGVVGETIKPVILMTVHMAKGLEFETVFMAGVAEGLLPHIRSIDSEDAIEEERRLMYVAMTRAKKKLFVSFYGLPSRFLSEIPNEYLQAASKIEDRGNAEGDDQSYVSYDEY